MRSKIFILAAVFGLSILIGCDQDTDTPPSLKRETYYGAKLKAADRETVSCIDAQIILPASDGSETLGLYILKIHAANRGGALATMELEAMQKLYRSCLRPAILNRMREVSRR